MDRTQDKRFELNPDADLDIIGELVSQALLAADGSDPDTARDLLWSLHDHLYPHSTQTMTAEQESNYRLAQTLINLQVAAGYALTLHDDLRANEICKHLTAAMNGLNDYCRWIGINDHDNH